MDISNYEERLDELGQLGELTEEQEEEFDLLEEVVRLIERSNYDIEALQAWLELGNDNFDDFEEAYQGEYSTDEDFAEQLCTECGDIPDELPSYIHIDWEWTAREIMMDYVEENGYYFRNL